MSESNKNKTGSGRARGSGKNSGRGHATLVGGGAGRGSGNNCRGQRLPGGSSVNAVLAIGLSYVGFGDERQKCERDLSKSRFRGHFGSSPKVIKALIALMKQYQPDDEVDLKNLLMALCWLKLYDTEVVMAGRWGYGEKHCREIVREYVQRIRALKPHLINFKELSPDCKYAPVDDMHVPCHEFRCDPNSIWWSHKFNGP